MAVGLSAVNALPFVLDTPLATVIIQNVGDSNIVLRFFGWVDQNHTAFLKGRSVAIQAAKSALENSGFALPEPIYRLRFDEGVSLPLKGAEGPSRRSERPPVKAADSPADEDTAPDVHVEQMVEEERSEAGKQDLLDDQRPIE